MPRTAVPEVCPRHGKPYTAGYCDPACLRALAEASPDLTGVTSHQERLAISLAHYAETKARR